MGDERAWPTGFGQFDARAFVASCATSGFVDDAVEILLVASIPKSVNLSSLANDLHEFAAGRWVCLLVETSSSSPRDTQLAV